MLFVLDVMCCVKGNCKSSASHTNVMPRTIYTIGKGQARRKLGYQNQSSL